MDSWLIDRIEAVKALIVELETALTGIVAGTILKYTIDTGQTRQTVELHNIADLQKLIDANYNLLATLQARVVGAAGQGRPAW